MIRLEIMIYLHIRAYPIAMMISFTLFLVNYNLLRPFTTLDAEAQYYTLEEVAGIETLQLNVGSL